MYSRVEWKKSDFIEVNGVEYWKECPQCNGTGIVGFSFGNPPEQCDCCNIQCDPEFKFKN